MYTPLFSYPRSCLLCFSVLAQLELDFNSVERVGEYLQAPQEAPEIIDEKRPPAFWPSADGSLVVEDLVVRYAPDLPAVLNSASFTVRPGEKIGVVSINFLQRSDGEIDQLRRSAERALGRQLWLRVFCG